MLQIYRYEVATVRSQLLDRGDNEKSGRLEFSEPQNALAAPWGSLRGPSASSEATGGSS